MANYKQMKDFENIYVEQNIYDNEELESYEAKFNFNGQEKTSVLYYHIDENKRFYSLGLLENLNINNLTIVADDLSEILNYKTAKTRRKRIFELIQNHESTIH